MTASHLLVPVPIPDRVAALIGSCIPPHILEAEFEADCAAREVRRFRGPRLGIEDQADREQALSELARANKILAAHHPRLAVGPGCSPDRTWAHRTARCRSRARRGPGRGRQG
ncbi:hypothetical protein SMICM17S_10838 [Streptomyces microflavus]